MTWSPVVVLIALAPACVHPGLAAWAPAGTPGYRGKYVDHAVYRRILADLPALRVRAVDRVNRLLGTSYRDDRSIWVRFADATDWNDLSRSKDRRRGRLNLKSRARTSNLRLGGRKLVAITFYLEHFVAGTANHRKAIVHELCHAIMRKLIPRYRVRKRIGGWFKEGLATLVAGQGPGRVRLKLAQAIRGRPEDLLTGLAKLARLRRPSGSHYWEYYLHTDSISAFGGKEALPALFGRLRRGVRLERAIAEVTGIAWLDFVRRSDARARKVLAALGRAHHWDAYRQARALRREDRLAGFRALRAFVEAHPASIFAPPARHLIARHLARLRRHREAITIYRELLGRHLRDYFNARHARYDLARSLIALGATAEARAHLERYLRDMASASKKRLRRARRLLERVRRPAR